MISSTLCNALALPCGYLRDEGMKQLGMLSDGRRAQSPNADKLTYVRMLFLRKSLAL